MVVVILSSVVLSSCAFFVGDVDWVKHTKTFKSHIEFADFIQEYNSKNDANVSSFISFDFDNYQGELDKYYNFFTRASYTTKDLYDKNTIDTNVKILFYFDNEIKYKIKCSYTKPNKTIFYKDDFDIKILNEDEMSGEYSIKSVDYQDERLSNNEGEKSYDFVYSLALLINGEFEMSIKISSTQEFNENQIDSISQVLLNNILIIGAGDDRIIDIENISGDNLEILFGSHTPNNVSTIYQTQHYATYYFYNLVLNYGNNYMGSCSYVSLAMLLSYYDSFWDDSIITNDEDEDVYDVPTLFNTTNLFKNISSPGIRDDTNLITAKLNAINAEKTIEEQQSELTFSQYYEVVEDNSNSYFHLKLIELGRVSKICEIYEFFNINPYGLGRIGREKLINHYLYTYRDFDKDNISYKCVTDNVEEYIIENVSEGIPVLVAVGYADGTGHAFIVYDYDSTTGKLYGHMGWGADMTHIDISSMNYLYIKNAATIEIKTPHSHNNNYIDQMGTTHCSCYFSCHPEHVHQYELSSDNNKHKYSCNCSLYDSNYYNHDYEYVDSDATTHIIACSECGYSYSEEHNRSTYLYWIGDKHAYKCKDCGYIYEDTLQSHSFDCWVYLNETTHKSECTCGANGNTTAPHAFTQATFPNLGPMICVGCGYTKMPGGSIGQIIKSINKVSINGSYILHDGTIMLVEEDIEAYLNGTLVFYDKDKLPVTQ